VDADGLAQLIFEALAKDDRQLVVGTPTNATIHGRFSLTQVTRKILRADLASQKR
jgi:hypothetical protein